MKLMTYLITLFIFFNFPLAQTEKDVVIRNSVDNLPPVAVLPGDREASIGDIVEISAGKSYDPEGLTLSYYWSFDLLPDNSNAQITALSSEASFIPDKIGLYLIKLIVRDEANNSRPAYIKVSVRDTNIPPTVEGIWYVFNGDALPMQIDLGVYEVSESDGEVAAYEYDFGDGNITYATAEENMYESLTHFYESSGDYTIKISVVDDKGGRTTVSRDIAIRNNRRPKPAFSASASSIEGTNNYEIRLDASGSSDPDGTITRYYWSIELENGNSTSYDNTLSTQVHTVLEGAEGKYKIGLEVTDDDGAFLYTSAPVYVGVDGPEEGSAPSLITDIEPQVGVVPLTVTFDASGTFDIDGDDVTIYWNFRDPSSAEFGAKGPIVQHTYNHVGTYDMRVTAMDSHGNLKMYYYWIHVRPTGNVDIEGGDIQIFAASISENPLSIEFDSERPHGLDNIPSSNHFWDFGDGTHKQGAYQEHIYEREGDYRVKLTTIDINGVRKTRTKDITVRGDGGFPTAQFDYSYDGSNTIIFDHSRSEDSTGAPLKFSYFFGDSTPHALDVSGNETRHSYTAPALVEAVLFVEEEGRTSRWTHAIPIFTGAQSDIPDARFSVSSRIGVAPFTVNFDGSFSTDNEALSSYHWFFGNYDKNRPDQYANTVQATHTYMIPWRLLYSSCSG